MNTLLLDVVTWDLLLDANGDIALASEPYSLAQDAASAILTNLGEVYFDTTIGIPYLQLFGNPSSISTLKADMKAAAETVPDVASAAIFITSIADRLLTGQVQVTSQATGQVTAASFTVLQPQGIG